jgi:hypothetical protein
MPYIPACSLLIQWLGLGVMSRNECAKKVTKKAGEERWGLGKGLLGLDVYGAQEAAGEVMEGITRRGEKKHTPSPLSRVAAAVW